MVFILSLVGYIAPALAHVYGSADTDDNLRVTEKTRVISELPREQNPAILDAEKYGLKPVSVLTVLVNPKVSDKVKNLPPGATEMLVKEVILRTKIGGTRYPIISKQLIHEFGTKGASDACKGGSEDKCGEGYVQVKVSEAPKSSENDEDDQKSSGKSRKKRHSNDSAESTTSTETEETNHKRSRNRNAGGLIEEAGAADQADEII